MKYRSNSNKALLIGMIPILIFIYCLLQSKGSFSSNDEGIVWLFYIGYTFSIGLIAMLYSVNLSLKSYNALHNHSSLLAMIISLSPIWLFIILTLFDMML